MQMAEAGRLPPQVISFAPRQSLDLSPFSVVKVDRVIDRQDQPNQSECDFSQVQSPSWTGPLSERCGVQCCLNQSDGSKNGIKTQQMSTPNRGISELHTTLTAGMFHLDWSATPAPPAEAEHANEIECYLVSVIM